MSPETVAALDRINERFYSQSAEHFDQTRSGPWRGWEKLLESLTITPSRPLRVLDVGCGNGRFASFLDDRLGTDQVSYTGCDRSSELLAAAQERLETLGCDFTLHQVNLLGDDYQGCAELPKPGQFDLVTCFGVMHHVPKGLQASLLTRCLNATAQQGVLCISFWQFGTQTRFQRRRVEWPRAAELGMIAKEHVGDLDQADWLLSWGQDGSRLGRYCRFNSPESIAALQQQSQRTASHFHADGATGELNHYLVLTQHSI